MAWSHDREQFENEENCFVVLSRRRDPARYESHVLVPWAFQMLS